MPSVLCAGCQVEFLVLRNYQLLEHGLYRRYPHLINSREQRIKGISQLMLNVSKLKNKLTCNLVLRLFASSIRKRNAYHEKEVVESQIFIILHHLVTCRKKKPKVVSLPMLLRYLETAILEFRYRHSSWTKVYL